MSENNKEQNVFIRLIGVLWRGKWIIIFCGFFIGGLVLFITFLMPKIYASEMTVILPESQTNANAMVTALTGGMSLGGLLATSVDMEVEVMGSTAVMEEVVEEYGLLADMTDIPLNNDKTPYLSSFTANETASGNTYYFEFINEEGDFIVYNEKGRYQGSGRNFERFNGAGFSFVMTCNSPEVGEEFDVDIYTPQSAAEVLKESVTVQAGSVDTIEVKAEGVTPVQAQNIVTAIVNKYIERTELYQSGNAGRLRSFLENQLNETKAKLEAASRELAEYSAQELVYDPTLEMGALVDTLNSLETQRMMAKVQRQVTERMLDFGGYSAGASADAAAATALGLPGATSSYDVATSNLETVVDQLRLELANLLTRYQEDHPLVVEKRQSLEEAEEELRIKKESKLESELEKYRTTELTVQREIERLEDLLRKQPTKYVEYTQLKTEVTALGEIYKFVTAQYEQARIDEQRALGNRGVPQVLTEATLQSKAVRPRKMVYTLVGGFLGGILGITIVLSRYYLRRSRLFERIKSEAAQNEDGDSSSNRRGRRSPRD